MESMNFTRNMDVFSRSAQRDVKMARTLKCWWTALEWSNEMQYKDHYGD
jgi:hypothetical protein